MKTKLIALNVVLAIILCFGSLAAAANHTMSWDFQFFNNPNMRQVALNIAKMQQDLIEDDPVDQFKESLERRLMSTLQRDIIRGAFDEEFGLPEGTHYIGDLVIFVYYDETIEKTIVTIENLLTGSHTTIELSDTM